MNASRRAMWLWLAAALLALTAVLIQLSKEVTPRQMRGDFSQLPSAMGEWQVRGQDQILDLPTLDLLKPTAYVLRAYKSDRGQLCSLFAAFFSQQQEGQMIHSPRNCLPGGGWKIMSRHEVPVTNGGQTWMVNHLVIGNELERLSVLYWYQGRGRVEPNEYWDRLRLISDGFSHQRSDGALVRLTTIFEPRDPELLASQVRLAGELIPALERLLPPMETPARNR